MPRKPTIYQRRAREGIIALLAGQSESDPLPTLRELGELFSLHPSTISRLLRDLETEGLIWQGPSGRFFAAVEGRDTLKGAPICFVGREMWQWSQLYQEILAGVSEVCSANGSPLVFQSAQTLVRVPVLLEPPVFATAEGQCKELRKILPNIPKGSAGILLDHLWCNEAIRSSQFPSGQRVQLLYGFGQRQRLAVPDYGAGFEMVAGYIVARGFETVRLVVPFEGDPLIDDCVKRLRIVLAAFGCREISFQDKETLSKLILKHSPNTCLVCPEDNIALGLAALIRELEGDDVSNHVEVIATQGTGVVTSPHSRLRYDYRRLGRAAASNILHGTEIKPMKPSLVTRAEECG